MGKGSQSGSPTTKLRLNGGELSVVQRHVMAEETAPLHIRLLGCFSKKVEMEDIICGILKYLYRLILLGSDTLELTFHERNQTLSTGYRSIIVERNITKAR